MSSNPIRQHWVPKVYLRSFCISPIESEQINAFDLDSGREFKTSIAKIAVKRHFYTLGLNSENPSFAIEHELSKIESDVKPLILELIKTEKIFSDIGTPGVHIHIPISPKLILYIHDHDANTTLDRTFNLTKAGVRGINGLTILSAEQYLFSHKEFSKISELLEDRPIGSQRNFGPSKNNKLHTNFTAP